MGAATAGVGMRLATTGNHSGESLMTVIANSSTSGGLADLQMTSITDGTAFSILGGSSMTLGGKIMVLNMSGATTGSALVATTTGVYTNSTSGVVSVVANSLTSGNAMRIDTTGITSGASMHIQGGSSMTSGGKLLNINMGSATTGAAIVVTNTGAYTDSSGMVQVTANSATTGKLMVLTGNGLTTGRGLEIDANALTSGNLLHLESVNTSASEPYQGNFFNANVTRTYTSDLSASDLTGLVVLTKNITANSAVFDDFSSCISLSVNDTFTTTDATNGTGLRVAAASGKITRNGSAASGETLNISANLFELQDSDLTGAGTLINSGHVLQIQQLESGATGRLIFMDSETTTSTQNVMLIQTDVAANDYTAWRVQANGATFADNAYTGTGADYAEYFKAAQNNIPKGTVVSIDQNGKVTPASSSTGMAIGVISTNPGFIGNNIEGADGTLADNADYALVGLNGQIPTTVSVVNGPIQAGDAITVSEVSGVGMKATTSGYVIGYALESTTVDAKIMVYVSAGWYGESAPNNSSSGMVVATTLDANNNAIINALSIASASGTWSVDENGLLIAKEIQTEKITTQALSVKKTDNTATIGKGQIEAGQSGATIMNPAIHEDSEVFVTFRGNTNGSWWIDNVQEGVFTLRLQNGAGENLTFSYWIVGVEDATTPVVAAPEQEIIPETSTEPEPISEVVPEPVSEPTSEPGPTPEVPPTEIPAE